MADAAVVLLILVAGASGGPPRSNFVGAGVREGLGGEARVLVEQRAGAPTEREARELATQVNANAVADLTWLDETRARAVVHVYVVADERFYDREVSFDPADAPDERERAVGLLVGAMVRAASAAAEPPAATPPPRVLPTPPIVAPPPRDAGLVATPVAPRRRWLALDVAATGALPFAGDGAGLGPSLGVHAYVVDALAVRASGAARFGTLPEADATTTTLRFGGGTALRVLGRRGEPFALHASLEAIALSHAVTRFDSGERQERWIGGALASLSAGWRIAPSFEAFAGAGIETAFGVTPIVVDGATTSILPPVRLTLDIGGRVHF